MRLAILPHVVALLVGLAASSAAQDPDVAPAALPVHGRGLNLPADLGAHVRQVNARLGATRLRSKPRDVQAFPASYAYPYLPPVRNQGAYGTCWDFASCGVMEMLYLAIGQAIDASEQYVLNHNSDGFGCNGGYVAFDFLESTGTAREADVPYRGCAARDSAKTSYRLESWAYVGDDQSIPSDSALKAALIASGPLAVAVSAGGDWDAYRGGKAVLTGRGAINHEVVICGYDDSLSAWLVRNSWGPTWGNEGYCWVRYGALGIGTGAAFAAVAPPPPPTPTPTPTPTPPPTPTPSPTPSPAPTPGPSPAPTPTGLQVVFVTPIWIDIAGTRYGLVQVNPTAAPLMLFVPLPATAQPTPQPPPAPPPAGPIVPPTTALPPPRMTPIREGPYDGPVTLVYVGERYLEFRDPSFVGRMNGGGVAVVAVPRADVPPQWARLSSRFPAAFWATSGGWFAVTRFASPKDAVVDLAQIRRGL